MEFVCFSVSKINGNTILSSLTSRGKGYADFTSSDNCESVNFNPENGETSPLSSSFSCVNFLWLAISFIWWNWKINERIFSLRNGTFLFNRKWEILLNQGSLLPDIDDWYQSSFEKMNLTSWKWGKKIAFLSFVLPYTIESNPIVQVLISCLWTAEKEEGSKRQTCHKRLSLRKSSSLRDLWSQVEKRFFSCHSLFVCTTS